MILEVPSDLVFYDFLSSELFRTNSLILQPLLQLRFSIDGLICHTVYMHVFVNLKEKHQTSGYTVLLSRNE